MRGILIGFLVCFTCYSAPLDGGELSARMAAKAGELCIICDGPVKAGDPAYLYEGQRVVMHPGEEARFLKDPERYMAKLKPDNIIMSSDTPPLASFDWIWVVAFVLGGLVFGGLAAQTAICKGRSPWKCFLAGLVFSVPAFLYLSTRTGGATARRFPPGATKLPLTRAPAPCPGCGYPNHPAATKCEIGRAHV